MLRLLDLEDLGAHVAEHHRAEGPGHDPREIDHPQSVEWRHGASVTHAESGRAGTTKARRHEDTKKNTKKKTIGFFVAFVDLRVFVVAFVLGSPPRDGLKAVLYRG